jgi:hypothetical protein
VECEIGPSAFLHLHPVVPTEILGFLATALWWRNKKISAASTQRDPHLLGKCHIDRLNPMQIFMSLSILSSHLRLVLPSGLFPSGFPTRFLFVRSS